MEGPVVSIRELTVLRGGRTVLSRLSMDLESGGVTGLLGPSGCGKTTLMRAIVGVQKVRSGRVAVLGLPAGTPPLRHRVAYVTQAPSVYADLTVAENLSYFARVLGVPRTAIGRVIELVRLRGHEGTAASRLSGGERSRLSLATALLSEPDLFVLDEPTVGLDPVLRRDLWDLFHSLAEAGATLIVSSHVMDEAERCHRLLLMRDGAIVAHDRPDVLLARTGTSSVEDAFLSLVEGNGGSG